mgnify:CR=1 FL=1
MYLVVFRNRKRAGFDQARYLADTERMEALAAQQPGYLSFKSFTADDGEVVAISEWVSRDAAKAWRAVADHADVQTRGRSEYYPEYAVITCEDPGIHRWP